MDIKVNRAELIDALASATKAVSPRSTITEMTHLLFSVEDERLVVSGTDAELSITCKVDADISGEPTGITVPPTLINNILPNLTKEAVKLTIKKDHLEVDGVAKIKGLPPTDFPKLPVAHKEILPLNSELLTIFRELLSPFTARTDKDRLMHPQWQGVRIRRSAGKIDFMALAGYEFSLWSDKSDGEDLDINVPVRVFDEAKGLTGASLWLDEIGTKVLLVSGSKVISSTLLETSGFINLPDFVRKKSDLTTNGVLQASDLLPAVRIALAMADKDSRSVNLDFKEKGLTISAESQNGKATPNLECRIEGKPLSINVNGEYLAKIIYPLQGNEVEIQMVPLDIVKEDGSKEAVQPNAIQVSIVGEPRFVHAIIPMR